MPDIKEDQVIDTIKSNRNGHTDPICHYLDNRYSPNNEQIKALLIKFIKQHGPSDSKTSDLLLVALNLLNGYTDDTIGVRRISYWENSPEFNNERTCINEYEDHLERTKAMKRVDDRLRKREDAAIKKMVKKIVSIKNLSTYVRDLAGYYDNIKKLAILPDPCYLPKTANQQTARMAEITANTPDNMRPSYIGETLLSRENKEPLLFVKNNDGHEIFSDYVANCLNKYRNAIVVICGDCGIGKTYQINKCYNELCKNNEYYPILVLAKYLPMLGNHESPILEYLSNQTDLLEEPTLAYYYQFSRECFSNGQTIVIFVDGINEYMINTTKENREHLFEEIERLQQYKSKTGFVISSRVKSGFDVFENVFIAEASKLTPEQITAYLSELGIPAPQKKELAELIELPLLLKLYTEMAADPCVDWSEITSSAQLIGKHIDQQMENLKGDGLSLMRYALKVFLPCFTMSISGNLNISGIQDKVYSAFLKTVSDVYYSFLRKNAIEYRTILSLVKECTTPLSAFASIFENILVEQSLYITQDTAGTLYWQHDLFRDWFLALGIANLVEVNLSEAIQETRSFVDYILENTDQEDATAAEKLPAAVFIYELLKDNNSINTNIEYLRLLYAITIAENFVNDLTNCYRFSELVMRTADEYIKTHSTYPLVLADIMHYPAYLFTVTMDYSDMTDTEITSNLDFAKRHIEKSLELISSNTLDCSSDDEDRQLIHARIYGNFGGYYLDLFTRSGKSDKTHLDNAYSYHKKAFEIRRRIYECNPNAKRIIDLMGNGYNMLATDSYYYGNYQESYQYHREAIKFRAHPSVRFIRLIQSCSRALGALMMLYETESVSFGNMLSDALELLTLPISSESIKRMLVLHRSELKMLVYRCTITIKKAIARNEVVNIDNLNELINVAEEYAALCENKNIDNQEIVAAIETIKELSMHFI